MDKEVLIEKNQFEELTAFQIWARLYNKELNSKKNILEYIEITKLLKKENVRENQIQDTYKFIYEHIEGLKDSIKPNTMMFLKNTLKAQLGKYVEQKDPKQVNHFIEFFKKAYPKDKRRKDFTRVLMDLNTISEEQIWTTIAYINRECLNGNIRLNSKQKKDIVEVIEKAVKKRNVKFINNLRSLNLLNDILHIRIISVGNEFRVKHI